MKTGIVRQETVVGRSSRSTASVPPHALLEDVRLHWSIENKIYWADDVNWQSRAGSAPHIVASLRNAVLNWLDLKKSPALPANSAHWPGTGMRPSRWGRNPCKYRLTQRVFKPVAVIQATYVRSHLPDLSKFNFADDLKTSLKTLD